MCEILLLFILLDHGCVKRRRKPPADVGMGEPRVWGGLCPAEHMVWQSLGKSAVSWVLLPAHLQHGKPLSSSERTSSPRSLSKAVPGLTQHIHMASNRDFSEVLGNSLSSDLCPQVSIIIRVPGIEGQSLGTSCCGVRRQSVAACRTMLTEEPRPPTSCVMISLEQVTQWRFSVAKCISLSTF